MIDKAVFHAVEQRPPEIRAAAASSRPLQSCRGCLRVGFSIVESAAAETCIDVRGASASASASVSESWSRSVSVSVRGLSAYPPLSAPTSKYSGTRI